MLPQQKKELTHNVADSANASSVPVRVVHTPSQRAPVPYRGSHNPHTSITFIPPASVPYQSSGISNTPITTTSAHPTSKKRPILPSQTASTEDAQYVSRPRLVLKLKPHVASSAQDIPRPQLIVKLKTPVAFMSSSARPTKKAKCKHYGACQKCHDRRRGCDGHRPCDLCAKRNIPCADQVRRATVPR